MSGIEGLRRSVEEEGDGGNRFWTITVSCLLSKGMRGKSIYNSTHSSPTELESSVEDNLSKSHYSYVNNN